MEGPQKRTTIAAIISCNLRKGTGWGISGFCLTSRACIHTILRKQHSNSFYGRKVHPDASHPQTCHVFAFGGAPIRLLVMARPMASRTSGSDLTVLVTSHSLTLLLRSLVACSSFMNGAVSIARSRPASVSLFFAIASNLTSCCRSCWEGAEADALDGGGGSRAPICDSAMNKVNVALRASWIS